MGKLLPELVTQAGLVWLWYSSRSCVALVPMEDPYLLVNHMLQ